MARQESVDALVGTTIGNYIVRSKLGSGAMGTVYLGEHPEIGKRVAIKILAIHLAEKRSMVERFMIEARAIGILEHPNIIEMFDFDVLEDGRSFYTMEYLQGETLSQRMKRGEFPLWELTSMLDQVCDALFAVHEKGIVHRDLKPSNLFLAKKGNRILLKILDFGIAKIHESLKRDGERMTSTGAVLGTPVYMSPEQALGQNNRVSLRSDIYSLGVILYKILADRYPIDGTSVQEVVAFHLMNEAIPLRQINPRIPESLAQVVMQCLRKDPALRYPSSAHLFAAYQEAVASLPPDWVVPNALNINESPPASKDAPAPLVSGDWIESFPSHQSGSGSPSFCQPPSSPPSPSISSQEEVARPSPGKALSAAGTSEPVPLRLAEGGLSDGGSRVSEGHLPRGRIVAFVVVLLLIAGFVGYRLFIHERHDPVPPAAASVEPPARQGTTPEPPTTPPRLIQVRITSEPDAAEVLVRRAHGDPVSRRTPFLMEFERAEAVSFTATRQGYREETRVLQMDRELVHLLLAPVAPEPPKPLTAPTPESSPPADMLPETPPMKVMKHEPKTFGNDLL